MKLHFSAYALFAALTGPMLLGPGSGPGQSPGKAPGQAPEQGLVESSAATALSEPAVLAPTVPTAGALATRAGDALLNASDLSFEINITHVGRTLLVRCWMKPEALRTEVFEHGRLVYAISLAQGQVTEFLAKGGPGVDGPSPADVWSSYSSPNPYGVDGTELCDSEFACLFGVELSTWLGASSDRPERLRHLIGQCQDVRPDEVCGVPCFHAMFQAKSQADDQSAPRSVSNEYYISVANGMMLRWDSSQQEQGREKLVRTRVFQNISTEPIPGSFEFALAAERMQRVLPDRAQPPTASGGPHSPETGSLARSNP